jgi:hypothetical protein
VFTGKPISFHRRITQHAFGYAAEWKVYWALSPLIDRVGFVQSFPGVTTRPKVNRGSVGLCLTRILRMPDGKPNLNGIWQTMNTANRDLQIHGPITALLSQKIGCSPRTTRRVIADYRSGSPTNARSHSTVLPPSEACGRTGTSYFEPLSRPQAARGTSWRLLDRAFSLRGPNFSILATICYHLRSSGLSTSVKNWLRRVAARLELYGVTAKVCGVSGRILADLGRQCGQPTDMDIQRVLMMAW